MNTHTVAYLCRKLLLHACPLALLLPHTVAHLCRKYKEHVIALGCPRLGVSPLLAALRKLQPSREHLTPIHSDFLQL